MGIKGDKMSAGSALSAEQMLEKLSTIEGVTSKKMFGGHGIFHDDKMFGLIDSKGNAFLKADKTQADALAEAGREQHSRMPYYSIPEPIWNDIEQLQSWATTAIELSK